MTPTIRTNAPDYAPGALVIVLGEGWQPAEQVTLVVNDDEGRTWQHEATVIAADDGTLTYDFTLPRWFVATYTLVASGPFSGTARWRFTDSVGTGPVTSGDNGDPAASELTLATPSSMAGRLLVAMVVVRGLGTNQVICTPTGWTTQSSYRTNRSSSISVQTFYRVTTGSEAPSYTWRLRSNTSQCSSPTSGTLSGKAAVGTVTAYAGVDVADAGGPILALSGASVSGTTASAPSVSGVPAGSIVVRHVANDGSVALTTATTSSTGIETTAVASVVRPASGGTPGPSGAVADADQPTTGASGSLTATNGGVGGNWVAQTIVLRGKATQLTLTIADTTAQLGTNLAPDGTPSDSPDGTRVSVDVDASPAGAGACYAWSGSLTVSSDLGYDVKVRAPAANTRLDLLTADPLDYAACTAGEPVGSSMFAGASPAGAWIAGQAAATGGRAHPFWLGLDVRWTDPPSATVGAGSLTFEAVIDW